MNTKLTDIAIPMLVVGIVMGSLIHVADSSQKIIPGKVANSSNGVNTKFDSLWKPSSGGIDPYTCDSSHKNFSSKAVVFSAVNISKISKKVTHNFHTFLQGVVFYNSEN